MAAYPIGYTEFQASYVGPEEGLSAWVTGVVNATMAQVAQDSPELTHFSNRMEMVRDGAGVPHHNLYLGFVPKVPLAEPLDPHNLNDAPVGNIGDPARDNSIGFKETKF